MERGEESQQGMGFKYVFDMIHSFILYLVLSSPALSGLDSTGVQLEGELLDWHAPEPFTIPLSEGGSLHREFVV